MPAGAAPAPPAPLSARALAIGRPSLATLGTSAGDQRFQREILPAVSRTFAITIPELPDGLWEVVTNAYLLCRIADTIEDDPGLSDAERLDFHARFALLVEGQGDARAFAEALAPRLSRHTLPAERELVRGTARVVRLSHGFDERTRSALARCVRTMCAGMPHYHRGRPARGLADLGEYHDYCYFVAGVVGEMLTQLFCEHSPAVAARRAELEQRAISFGCALQMTNILKDVWEDLERGYCWLPRELFQRHGFDLAQLAPGKSSPAYEAGVRELVAIAHGHLVRALEYVLAIPSEERGIRRFCLFALGMSLLTLRKIARRPGYRSAREVKIRRRSVRATILVANLALRSDRALRALFGLLRLRLPAPIHFECAAPAARPPG